MDKSTLNCIIQKVCPFTFEIQSYLIQHSCWDILYDVYSNQEYISKTLALNRLINHAQFQECSHLFDDMNAIQYSIIKGAALSHRIFGYPSIRQSCDIDILISETDIDVAVNILKNNGFLQGKVSNNGDLHPCSRDELVFYRAFTHQIAPFIKKSNNPFCPIVTIDINTNIIWGERKNKIDMAWFLQHNEIIRIAGVEVKVLSPVFEFISLCLHHYKDMNSLYLLWKRGIALSLFSDIYFYIKNVDFDIHLLKSISNHIGIEDIVFCCLYHTNEIFSDHKLQHYLSFFDRVRFENIIKRIGLCENEFKYLPKGISSYVFDNTFRETLRTLLSDTDIHKIEMNEYFL